MKEGKKTESKNYKDRLKVKSNCETSCKAKEVIEKFPHKGKKYIIPLLQKVQEIEGYIGESAMDMVSEKLNVPMSQIYGVVTFYSLFRLQPLGKYHLKPCQGTACHVRGSKRILNAIKNKLEIRDIDTTLDNKFTLTPVACLGTCGLAPVMMIGDTVYGNLNEEKVGKIIDKLKF
ncbi:MAG: NADH-quinone oxidoreductase subunit NuoE [bacterium]